MDEERSTILRMLAEGRISPEQAEQLLEAIEEGAVTDPVPLSQPTKPEAGRGRQGGWLDGLTTDQIVQLKIHGVDPAFPHQARRLGLRNLSFEQLIELSIHGIDASYVRQFHELGIQDLSFELLLEFAVHGIDANYVKELDEVIGLKDLRPEQIVELAIHGVDAEFIREARAPEPQDVAAHLLQRPATAHGEGAPVGEPRSVVGSGMARRNDG